MGSKKNIKHEEKIEQIVIDSPKKNRKRKLKSENDVIEIHSADDDILSNEETHEIIPKKKKKKSKIKEEISLSDDAVANTLKVVKNGAKKRDIKTEELEIHQEVDIKSEMPRENDSHVTMSQSDILEMLRRISLQIPDNDRTSSRSREKRIIWDNVAFSHYSTDDCKETWNNLQTKIRRYRLLKEVLNDVQETVLNPAKGKNIHPDMPKKPLTCYQLFYNKKKPILLAQNPGLDVAQMSKQMSEMYKKLSVEKRAKYEKLVAQAKAKYATELEIFYANHPEIEQAQAKKRDDKQPVKPKTAFMLYFLNQLKKNAHVLNLDDMSVKSEFKEQCKGRWKNLAAKKKVNWITRAEEDIKRYEEECAKYIEKYPNYIQMNTKHLINKDERVLLDRFSGKPEKPPNSAYALFSKIMQKSEEIKEINAKDRMAFIANKWKNCTEDEKSNYKNQANELMNQYKTDYEKYLNSLPEDKKLLEIEKYAPKKKQKSENSNKKKTNNVKLEEPSPPPISAFRYFADLKNLDFKTAKKAWKKLSEDKRQVYEKKLVEIKRNYISEYEKFLNSLTKEELEQYSKSKQELKINVEDGFGEDESTSSSSSEYEEEEDDD